LRSRQIGAMTHDRKKRRNKSNQPCLSPRKVYEQQRPSSDEPQQIIIALAVAVIEGMLNTYHAFQQARLEGKRTRVLPLNPVQYMVLEATLDLLRQHVDPLKSEASG
jgi:hypothetical protein